MEFKNLHYQSKPLLLCNVWDVPSSEMAATLNFQAIGTSSSAIASLLGYNDGEELAFSELEYVVKRITSNTNLPVSVDLESGYSRKPIEIAEHIKRLTQLGVVGINIEDSIVLKERTLLNADEFSQTLSEVKELLEKTNTSIFINVRTDTFLLGHTDLISETKNRIDMYENAGADGIFIPCIERVTDIKEIVNTTDLPLNVMCMPNLPNFDTLSALGVKRISMGNFLFDNMYANAKSITQKVLLEKSFIPIF